MPVAPGMGVGCMFNPDLGFTGTRMTLAPMKGLFHKWKQGEGICVGSVCATIGETVAQEN